MESSYIVVQYRSGEWPNVVWDFQGVFSDRQKAVDACRNERYAIFPAHLNQELPDEPVIPSGVEYPKGE